MCWLFLLINKGVNVVEKGLDLDELGGKLTKSTEVSLYINKKEYACSIPIGMTLLELLREKVGFLGTKNGCNSSQCGACTVLLEGKAINSCSLLAIQANGKYITTIEGLGDEKQPHPIQEAFVEKGAIQCGFCTPGMIMSAKDLLDNNPRPSDFEIKEAISGNLCRCTGYTKIIDAVKSAANELSLEETPIKEVK